ncbi:exodeoxyribonuclease V subunit beta [Candidatus Profftia sp. (ex Adelges kitamiensis)]|uniref:exodeoxyribonuclease V subunit beta n=1 Tax=Candidatus Profftia sp. (ex Adelges kitamiensis) TaxID=2864218 RepID=UPI001CE38AC1|nr:exodeoxyribonuclease V subunit beta [Candidatus Profftia sp. (ex Adelges kitamiensis)]
MTKISALDIFNLPITGGTYLIEASAGTGKTSTIILLYLRLLLGIGRQNNDCIPFSIEKILVVTFTEAAIKELRGRIFSYICELRLACMYGKNNNPLFSELFNLIDDKKNAICQLLIAERKIDEAAIYTIHGFCQHILKSNAFESGALFNQILLQDELPLYQQACTDFWRRSCYPLPLIIAAAITEEWHGPEQLLIDLQPYLQGKLPEISYVINTNKTLVERHKQIIENINTIKEYWRKAVYDIKSVMKDSSVDNYSDSNLFLSKWFTIISNWATTDTRDYQLPNNIRRFGKKLLLEKTKKDNLPYYKLFIAIEALLDKSSLSLHDLFFSRALIEVRRNIELDKKQHMQLGFNDLITSLYNALHKSSGDILSKAILQRYHVAMIDEFQDTDLQQYSIFKKVYGKQSKYPLFLIGDPKQSIYSFRGADIFTYIHARREIKDHYTLCTNWRSSSGMVSAVNHLFSITKYPFIFLDIPFSPVGCAKENSALYFEIEGHKQPAMHIWLQPGEGCSIAEYQKSLANKCANQIRDWLYAGQQRKALLYTKKKDLQGNAIAKFVHPSDITILVRNNDEAILIRNALSALFIPSVYLSNRNNIFKTQEAKDIMLLLQAVLTPEKKHLLRSALATNLMGLNAQQIDDINKNENQWDALIDEFEIYRDKWQKQGVFSMLRSIMIKRNIAEDLLVSPKGERSLTDLLHICELLQEASSTLYNPPLLLRWLANQIDKSNIQLDNQQIRLENYSDMVQIMTIHKSKGLEFPIVWLPFISSFRIQKKALYHDREYFNTILDLNNNKKSVKLAEEERLAEDLRLLYVALTRSIYHCSIGIAPLFLGRRKKQGETDIHKSAIGYLIQNGKSGNSGMLLKSLQCLHNSNIVFSKIKKQDNYPLAPIIQEQQKLQVKIFTRNMRDHWNITSYSSLKQHGINQSFHVIPKIDSSVAIRLAEEQITRYTIHDFPKGAHSGIFLHYLLERLNFNQPIDIIWLTERVNKHGLSIEWVPVLQNWLNLILYSPLAEGMPCLAQIPLKQMQSELKFCLSVNNLISSNELDYLIKCYDPLSNQCPILDFQYLHGILQGCIDLIFCWQERYYILDYKSNWLGKTYNAYTQKSILAAMVERRYDFQYQLYSLALHRYLRQRLSNYQYEHHFGGVFYCFLRGMTPKYPQQGIFYCCPNITLIKGIDKLFSNINGIQ